MLLRHFTCISKQNISIIFLLYENKEQERVSVQIVKKEKMKNVKVAFWTARQSQTKTFRKFVLQLAINFQSKLCVSTKRQLSSSLNLPKTVDKICFPFISAKGRHFMVRGSNILKLSPYTAIDSSF